MLLLVALGCAVLVAALRDHGTAANVTRTALSETTGAPGAALQAPARSPAVLVDAAAHHVRVDAVATATQTVLPGRGSFEVYLGFVDGVPVSVPALVFGEGPAQRLGIGTRIALDGTVVRAEAGDDRAFLFFPDEPPVVVESPPWYLDWACRGT
ncbi:hypothetical protein SAMN06296378_1663 [Salinibacterium xinjiangense]|uniref:Uncharacterized protein n=1 Tax=Salinibacterium xinjiangense TaxID=386302 RepID=A0A2C8ZM45_9MICO|nr:hypothetical protein SAMN06296378_1663 [Salinibacterium xinjiangense]